MTQATHQNRAAEGRVLPQILCFSGTPQGACRSRKRGGRNPRPYEDLSPGAPPRGSPELASSYPCGVRCRLHWHRRAHGRDRTCNGRPRWPAVQTRASHRRACSLAKNGPHPYMGSRVVHRSSLPATGQSPVFQTADDGIVAMRARDRTRTGGRPLDRGMLWPLSYTRLAPSHVPRSPRYPDALGIDAWGRWIFLPKQPLTLSVRT